VHIGALYPSYNIPAEGFIILFLKNSLNSNFKDTIQLISFNMALIISHVKSHFAFADF
jgi:hypothetical protein